MRSPLVAVVVAAATALTALSVAVPASAVPPPPSVSASPLAANGFESPSCTNGVLFASLSDTARTDCENSGVAVAPVPMANYGFDTDIPSGLNASGDEDVGSILTALLLTPVWTGLVWLVHVVVVALEWCYSIDLLAPNILAAAARALDLGQRIFTDPWLGLALAIAAVGFVWHGLIRRRVIETVGQAAVMCLMMVIALWIIADPTGTVGSVGRLADQAALGTLAATSSGSVNRPTASLDDALGSVFSSAIDGPWCYLEFGDVQWCRDPGRLDGRLQHTADELERIYHLGATCSGSAPGLVKCAPGGSAEQRSLMSAEIALRGARTNGELFLALPSGGLARNSLTSPISTPTLYGTLCGASDPSACTASTAPQAEFRTEQGIWARAGGLLLITIGVLGMLATLGFLAWRLLGAALATLLYLMLAPLAVLAPALGESGRATFRLWLTRLFGAALAKLVYSVSLGMTLLVLGLLSGLDSLGWWTQWLLVSVFWWTTFEQRHRLLGHVIHERSEPMRRMPAQARARLLAFGIGGAAGVAEAGVRGSARAAAAGREVLTRAREFGGDDPRPPGSARIGGGTRVGARAALESQTRRTHELESAAAAAAHARSPVLRDEIATLRARRERLASARGDLSARGSSAPRERRRDVSLALRERRVDAQIAGRTAELAQASSGARGGRRATARALARSERALDREAVRPIARRDHGAAAGLAGLSAQGYARATATQQRAARVAIARELDQRRVWLSEAGALPRERIARIAVNLRGVAPPAALPSGIARRARQFGSRGRLDG